MLIFLFVKLEPQVGLEPTTLSVQMICATNCAIVAYSFYPFFLLMYQTPLPNPQASRMIPSSISATTALNDGNVNHKTTAAMSRTTAASATQTFQFFQFICYVI